MTSEETSTMKRVLRPRFNVTLFLLAAALFTLLPYTIWLQYGAPWAIAIFLVISTMWFYAHRDPDIILENGHIKIGKFSLPISELDTLFTRIIPHRMGFITQTDLIAGNQLISINPRYLRKKDRCLLGKALAENPKLANLREVQGFLEGKVVLTDIARAVEAQTRFMSFPSKKEARLFILAIILIVIFSVIAGIYLG